MSNDRLKIIIIKGKKSKKKEELKQCIVDRLTTGGQVEVAPSKENPSWQEINEAKEKGKLLTFHLERGVTIPGFKVLELRSEKPGIFMRLERGRVVYNLSCYRDSGFGKKRGNGHLIQEKS